jgi:hypothetical protein
MTERGYAMVQQGPERRKRSNVSQSIQPDTARDDAPRPDEDRIRQRAYERYRERGSEDGHDVDDWLEAERELRD